MQMVYSSISKNDADAVADNLKKYGATVEVKKTGNMWQVFSNMKKQVTETVVSV